MPQGEQEAVSDVPAATNKVSYPQFRPALALDVDANLRCGFSLLHNYDTIEIELHVIKGVGKGHANRSPFGVCCFLVLRR